MSNRQLSVELLSELRKKVVCSVYRLCFLNPIFIKTQTHSVNKIHHPTESLKKIPAISNRDLGRGD